MSQSNHFSDFTDNSLSVISTNRKQIFELIDSIVSLESCLHYQFLPLALRDNVLILGMINPEDRNGYNFIYPIVSSLGYSLEIFELDSQTHQLVLAAYLKRDLTEVRNSNSDQPRSSLQSDLLKNSAKKPSGSELDYSLTLTDIPANPPNLETPPQQPSGSEWDYSLTLTDIPPTSPNLETPPQQPSGSELDYSLTLTDISPTPANLETPPQQPSGSELDYSLTLTDIPPTPPNNSNTPNLHDRPTLIVDPQEESTLNSNPIEDAISIFQPAIVSSEPQITNSNSPELNHYQLNQIESNPSLLEVKARYINGSVDTLSSLAPQQLWQELLARILDGGIGRLYLERQANHGRIIWSRDGVIQSSLERVEIPIFEHIIQEIKILGKQPLTPIEKPKKVATEKFYNQERVLLRIEFFLNQYGEEITIQVLRGKALKFYEQRQVKRMMEQAVSLSQKLEKILKKMIFCTRSGELDDISSLKAIYEQIEVQIKLLEKKQAKNPQE
ncbi:MAG: hypothetical protein QNJ65_04425 [Xenococcaceae cyanobacterium MO_234.B1]|nr:hypothetical protein [Xenococcaceae cyanobacterium MO_234.B1]